MPTQRARKGTPATASVVDGNGPKERGSELIRLSVQFSAEATPTKWRDLIIRLGFQDGRKTSPPASDESFGGSFVALPDHVIIDSLYLVGEVHSLAGKSGVAHWHIDLIPSPSDNPPAQLVADSKKVGGYPGVLDTLFDSWPGIPTAVVSADATYRVDVKRFSAFPSKFLHKAKTITVRSDDTEHALNPSITMGVWDAKPPIGQVSQITVLRLKDTTAVVTATGVIKLGLDPTFIGAIDKRLWSGLRMFLEAAK